MYSIHNNMSMSCRICFRTDREVRTRLYKDTLYRNFFATFITKWIPRHIWLCPLCVNIMRQMIQFRKQAHLVDCVMRTNIVADSFPINGQICSNTKNLSIHNCSIRKLDNIDLVFSVVKLNNDNEGDICSIDDKKEEKNYRNKSKIVKKRILINNDADENMCKVILVASNHVIDGKKFDPKNDTIEMSCDITENDKQNKNEIEMNDQSKVTAENINKHGGGFKKEGFKVVYEMNDQSKVTAENINKHGGRFEKDGFKVVYLSEEEQVKEIEDKKKTRSYLGRKFKCESCGLGFLTEDVMANHMAKHSQIFGNFECDICKQRFSTAAVLTQHSLAHRRYFQCIYCLSKLRRPWHCSVHRAKCDLVRKTLVCEYCKKLYSNEHSLSRHVKCVHYNEKKFTCDVCEKSFSNKQRLLLHIRTHTGQRPFECTTCARRFTTNSNLKEHQRSVHSQTRDRYYCVECDTYFKMAKSLKRHLLLSSKHAGQGGTRFECQKCLKYFQSERTLTSHYNQIHLKMSSYKCGVCDKMFSTSSNLRKHKRNVHNMKTGDVVSN